MQALMQNQFALILAFCHLRMSLLPPCVLLVLLQFLGPGAHASSRAGPWKSRCPTTCVELNAALTSQQIPQCAWGEVVCLARSRRWVPGRLRVCGWAVRGRDAIWRTAGLQLMATIVCHCLVPVLLVFGGRLF